MYFKSKTKMNIVAIVSQGREVKWLSGRGRGSYKNLIVTQD